ncbi:MAG TPA: GNAT family N-acetyltransferase [Anaerolineaceae bacterium]|nr:GNAT family N-acetyltransferase [Anaerolineaceae bacterium]
MPFDPVVRPARLTDYAALANLLETGSNVHRHLDWRPALEWLGHDPFWVIEENTKILAALACPPDPPGVAWIRLFAVLPGVELRQAWQSLFEHILEYFRGWLEIKIAVIAIYPWFANLIKQMDFHLHQEIVILEWENVLPPYIACPPSVKIRRFDMADLPEVTAVDNRAFDPLWQNSFKSLGMALKQSAYATLAEVNGEIVGYQICTAGGYSAHLARLAVLPKIQKHSIGYLLVQDLLKYFSSQNVFRVTVNTQENNYASLGLYRKMGFWLTGDQFDVYLYNI